MQKQKGLKNTGKPTGNQTCQDEKSEDIFGQDNSTQCLFPTPKTTIGLIGTISVQTCITETDEEEEKEEVDKSGPALMVDFVD